MRCWKRSVCLLLAGVLALSSLTASSLTAADVKDLIAPNAEVKTRAVAPISSVAPARSAAPVEFLSGPELVKPMNYFSV